MGGGTAQDVGGIGIAVRIVNALGDGNSQSISHKGRSRKGEVQNEQSKIQKAGDDIRGICFTRFTDLYHILFLSGMLHIGAGIYG